MSESVQPEIIDDDAAIEETQRALPRLTLKLLFVVLTLSAILVWSVRLMLSTEHALSCLLTVSLMIVACFVMYGLTFLAAWSVAEVWSTIRPPVKSPATHAAGLIDNERWQ